MYTADGLRNPLSAFGGVLLCMAIPALAITPGRGEVARLRWGEVNPQQWSKP